MKKILFLIAVAMVSCVLTMNYNYSYAKTFSVKTRYEGIKKYSYNGRFIYRMDGKIQEGFFPNIDAQEVTITKFIRSIGAGTIKTTSDPKIWAKCVRVWAWLQKHTITQGDPQWKKADALMMSGKGWPSIGLIAKTFRTYGFIPWGTCMSRAHLLTTLLYRAGIPKDRVAIAETRWKKGYSQHMYTIVRLHNRWYYLDPSCIGQKLPDYPNIHSVPLLYTVNSNDYLHPNKIKIISGANLGGVPLVTERASTILPIKDVKRPSPVSPAPSEALPDLVVVDISLNRQCQVRVTVKNLGPGRVPDDVWTEHKPESSSVSLSINGKHWGGGSIWGFDPKRSLQQPGGTSVYQSRGRVQGEAKITAIIDDTRQITEANEANNKTTKTLRCGR